MKNTKKSPRVDLERKKSIFFEMGMAIALLLVFAAFQWKSLDKRADLLIKPKGAFILEENVPVTVQKPPPPAIPPKPVFVINIVDSDIPIDDFPEIDASADDNTQGYDNFPVEQEERIKEPEIFTNPQIMPEFPGGLSAMMHYFATHINYPEEAKEANIQGVVYVNFVVEPDGSISHVKVLRGIGGGCDEESVRVVKNMPHWKPGIQAGRPVSVSFTIPVKFTLR